MNSLYILNQNFVVQGVIDSFSSLIWRPSYSDVGDFELFIGANKSLVELLQVNNYLVRNSDITVDSEGKVTYTKVMLIKGVEIITNVEDGDYLNITGRELKYLLHQRIVWSQTNLTGTAENAIRTLVSENAINPTDTKRIIPNLVLGASAGLTDTIEKQITGEYLDKAIIDICTTYNYGWDMFIYDGQMVLIVYTGLDRSYGQSERPYVVFSDSFDNLFNTDYELNNLDYANTTLIGGEGEGTERTYTVVNNSNTGLNLSTLLTLET